MTGRFKILSMGLPDLCAGDSASMVDVRMLEDYQMIIVNPRSPLHLLTSLVEDPDICEADDETGIAVVEEHVFRGWEFVSEMRAIEIASFLLRGGTMVFFLSPPNNITSADGSRNLDNYFWLENLAPDGISSGGKRKITRIDSMGPVALTAAGAESPFASLITRTMGDCTSYIKKADLAPGYVSLAETADGRCVAGMLPCGDGLTGIVFLPGPYQQVMDDALAEALKVFGQSQAGIDTPSQGSGGSLKDLLDKVRVQQPPVTPKQSLVEMVREVTSRKPSEDSPLDNSHRRAAALKLIEQLESGEHDLSKLPITELPAATGAASLASKAYDVKEPVWRNSLLSLATTKDEESFARKCMILFQEKELTCVPSETCEREFIVTDRGGASLIFRIAMHSGRSVRKELAALAESVIQDWAKRTDEPSGLLILASGSLDTGQPDRDIEANGGEASRAGGEASGAGDETSRADDVASRAGGEARRAGHEQVDDTMASDGARAERRNKEQLFERLAAKYHISLTTVDAFIEDLERWYDMEEFEATPLVQIFDLN